MIITIHGEDYSAALDAGMPLEIQRDINSPSICNFRICLQRDGSLGIPARIQAVSVTGDDGTQYFTGYIATSPVPVYLGLGIAGPVYGYLIQAASDEILLDQYLLGASQSVSGMTVGSMLSSLVSRTGSSALSARLLTLDSLLGNIVFRAGASWSTCAGVAAAVARAAYKAVNGVLQLTSMQSVVHELDESTGTLAMANLEFHAPEKRALANDVTV